jgi:anti-sigma factor RsiW
MSKTHPSDETLQQYVLERTACSAEDVSHIETCPDCRAAVAAYNVLTNELAVQPAPAFDFDLAAAVITQLEKTAASTTMTPRVKHGNAGAVLTIVLIAGFIGVALWLFRRSAYFVFTGMSAVFYGLVLFAAGIVVGLSLLRLYKKYQQVINLINE